MATTLLAMRWTRRTSNGYKHVTEVPQARFSKHSVPAEVWVLADSNNEPFGPLLVAEAGHVLGLVRRETGV